VLRKFAIIHSVALLAGMAPATSALGTQVGAPASGCPAEPDQVEEALKDLYNLEFLPARQALEAWLREHPDDLRALNYLSNAILDQELLKKGLFASEAYTNKGDVFRKGKTALTPGFEKEFLASLEKAQKAAEDRLQKNPADQDALYWAGMAHAARSEFHFILERSYLAALREGSEARKYHLKLYKLNPNYVDALLVIGIGDYVAGSLPWYVKVLASLAGLRGSRPRGLAELKRVSEEGHRARVDAKIILVTLYRRDKMYPEALALLEELVQSYPGNFLGPMEMAAVYEDQNNWRAAAKVYGGLVQKLRQHARGYEMMPAAKILYRAGRVHERLGDMEEALQLYDAAGRFPGPNLDTYRASLAAAELDRQLDRPAEALRNYRRVAGAVPNTEEGKVALRALQSYH